MKKNFGNMLIVSFVVLEGLFAVGRKIVCF